MTPEELRSKVVESLKLQGFYVNGHVAPKSLFKSRYKKIQAFSKKEQIKLQSSFLKKATEEVSEFVVDGKTIDPYKIDLELRLVEEGTIENTLYRWWNLMWWSVPYQKAYGRQMRFLLWDKTHNAPFGLIGLQSPVLKMSVRDEHLQIPKEDLDYIINKSMQAQRLGALPPYNNILGGKMVGLTLTSNELREAYKVKYQNTQTILKERVIEPDLLFITTTSAFGRSSVYNRLKYNNEIVAQSLGYTKGSGTFHITEAIYAEILAFLKERDIEVSTTFGYGASRKMKLIDQALCMIDLDEYHYHNIQREYFIFPIAKNLNEVIHNSVQPNYYDRPLIELFDFWKERWALPRSVRDETWKNFNSKNFITAAKRNITRWSK